MEIIRGINNLELETRLKQLRKEADYSTAFIAEQMGVTEFTIDRWEDSTKLPVIDRLAVLCSIYESSLSYALGLSDVKANNDTNTINLRLTELRKQHRLSRPDLSQISGIHINSFFNWEKGTTQVRLDSAVNLANYFKVSLDYFLGLTKHPSWEEFQVNAAKSNISYNENVPVWIISKDQKDPEGQWGLWDRKNNTIVLNNGDKVPYPTNGKVLPLDVNKAVFLKS